MYLGVAQNNLILTLTLTYLYESFFEVGFVAGSTPVLPVPPCCEPVPGLPLNNTL